MLNAIGRLLIIIGRCEKLRFYVGILSCNNRINTGEKNYIGDNDSKDIIMMENLYNHDINAKKVRDNNDNKLDLFMNL